MTVATARYAYYPGCSLHSTAREYDLSTKFVARAAGIDLVEVPDWNCCGASSAHVTDPFLGFALPARVLAKAEETGLDVVAPCAACYGRLVAAREEAVRHPEYVKRFGKATGLALTGKIRVLNVLEFLAAGEVTAAIEAGVKRPLDGLTVAPYYGCLLVRPPKVTRFDNAENPTTMDKILRAIGATPADFPFKTECCGASLGISRTDLVAELAGRILAAVQRAGADAVSVACPLCHTNLDSRQVEAGRLQQAAFKTPVYYVTQLVGLALGGKPRELGLGRHLVDPLTLLREKKLA